MNSDSLEHDIRELQLDVAKIVRYLRRTQGYQPSIRSVRMDWDRPEHNTKELHLTMSSITIKDQDAGATATITLVDDLGQTTTADSPPAWTDSSNGSVITLTVAADGMSAHIAPVGVGSAQVVVTVTDTDQTTFSFEGSVDVVAGEARTGSISFVADTPAAAPTPSTPAAPPATPTTGTASSGTTAPDSGTATPPASGTAGPDTSGTAGVGTGTTPPTP